MILTDKEFMEYVKKGANGEFLLIKGTKVTTEKLLEFDNEVIAIVGGMIRLTDSMRDLARRGEVLEIEAIDETDDTIRLSDGKWYRKDLLTIL